MIDIENTNTAELAVYLQQAIAGASGWFDGQERERFCDMMPLAKELVKRTAETATRPALHSDSYAEILAATMEAWQTSLVAAHSGSPQDVLASNRKMVALADVMRPHAQDDATRGMLQRIDQQIADNGALAEKLIAANEAAAKKAAAKPKFGFC